MAKKNDKKMSALELLKLAATPQEYINFDQLTIGEHLVDKIEIGTTKDGKRLRVSLADNTYLFLPERFMKQMTPEIVEELNSHELLLVYGGKDPKCRNRLILDFKLADSIFDDIPNI